MSLTSCLANPLDRSKAMKAAVIADPALAKLLDTCRYLNKITPKDENIYPYSIDHIVPRSQGGIDMLFNLWICPNRWNILNAPFHRGPNTIKAICAWIEVYGRVCADMPRSILLAEKADLLEDIRLMRVAHTHPSYERILSIE